MRFAHVYLRLLNAEELSMCVLHGKFITLKEWTQRPIRFETSTLTHALSTWIHLQNTSYKAV